MHLKLQRSVTESRKSRICLPCESKSLFADAFALFDGGGALVVRMDSGIDK